MYLHITLFVKAIAFTNNLHRIQNAKTQLFVKLVLFTKFSLHSSTKNAVYKLRNLLVGFKSFQHISKCGPKQKLLSYFQIQTVGAKS